MAARVALVLRSGGEYHQGHAYALAEQIYRYALFFRHELLLLTDAPLKSAAPGPWEVVPLRYNWPGWWSKLELMRPDIEGDLLYLDLDTRVVGDLSDIRKVDKLTMLADPYRPTDLTRFGSGVMYLTADARRVAWDQFTEDPAWYMRWHAHNGDQEFLRVTWGQEAIQRWQDLLPGQLVSYKCDVRGKGVPSNARIVYFHGQPRPWNPKVTEL